MMRFPSIPLEDCGIFISDGNYASKYPRKSEFIDKGVPFLSAYNIVEGRISLNKTKYISEELHDQLTKGHVKEGDVLLVTRGSLGRTAIVTKEFEDSNINAQLVLLRSNNLKINNIYFYFLTLSDFFQNEVRSYSSGTAQPQLPVSALRKMKILAPPLPIQHKIAAILSAYDDLIENNLRRIKILENMAQSLYHEWFVKYRFPGHENVRFVDSPLGKIPEGWEVAKLAKLIKYDHRSTKSGSHLEGRRYVPIDCLPKKSLGLLTAKSIKEARSSLRLFEKGDILFGAMRPYFHKVVIAPFAGVTRTTCFVLKPIRQEWHAFATMHLFDEKTIAYANSHSQGATIPYAVWDNSLSEMPIVLPIAGVLRRFEGIVAPILSRLTQSYFIIRNLRKTRDLLLPKLISGELDVTNIDITVPEDVSA